MKFIKAINEEEIYINIDAIQLIYKDGEEWRATVGGAMFIIESKDAEELVKKPIPKEKIDTTQDVIRVMVEYNRITGKTFEIDPVAKAYASLIDKRLQEGFTVDDFVKVIQYKYNEWGDDKVMSKYIVPTTLFRPSKFTAYLQEAKSSEVAPVENSSLTIF